ncbi:MAG: DUF3019 domain-containing protein [Colwellia sp.]|nr:DUF3019 domain-containing protein [Colwellia sp.]
MYFKVSKVLTGLTLLLLYFIPYSVNAVQEKSPSSGLNSVLKLTLSPVLTAQPTSCITLHQGRECFTNITIHWQSIDVDDYCLFQEKKKLRCWNNSRSNIASITFESSENITFYLMKRDSDTVLAETTITVGWVHKATPRKRRWRLF